MPTQVARAHDLEAHQPGFTVLNYALPLKGVLPMHCSANTGQDGDTALFFGLSGTGKTTLSSDPRRYSTTRRFGTILENVVIDPGTRALDLDDASLTENTHASYPIAFIDNAEPSSAGGARAAAGAGGPAC